MTQKIKGGRMMWWLGSGASAQTIAFATSHTLSITFDGETNQNKDEGNGLNGVMWETSEITQGSWTGSSDNLFAFQGSGATVYDLFDLAAEGTNIHASFGYTSTTGDTPSTNKGWSEDSTKPRFEGDINITNIEITGEVGQVAKYSVQWRGNGKLSKVTT